MVGHSYSYLEVNPQGLRYTQIRFVLHMEAGRRFGATVPAACQALGRALGVIPLARSTLALGPAL